MGIRPGPETNIFSISKKIFFVPCDGAECAEDRMEIPVGGKERK